MRAGGHEADDRILAVPPGAGMEGDAATACAMGRAQRRDVSLQARLGEGVSDQPRFPGRVEVRREMLRRATAAGSEQRAERRDTRRRGRLDRDEPARVRPETSARHDFARQRAGDVNGSLGPVRDAVASLAEPFDGEAVDVVIERCSQAPGALSAAIRNSRLPSPPAMGDGMTPTHAPAEPLRIPPRRLRTRRRGFRASARCPSSIRSGRPRTAA